MPARESGNNNPFSNGYIAKPASPHRFNEGFFRKAAKILGQAGSFVTRKAKNAKNYVLGGREGIYKDQYFGNVPYKTERTRLGRAVNTVKTYGKAAYARLLNRNQEGKTRFGRAFSAVKKFGRNVPKKGLFKTLKNIFFRSKEQKAKEREAQKVEKVLENLAAPMSKKNRNEFQNAYSLVGALNKSNTAKQRSALKKLKNPLVSLLHKIRLRRTGGMNNVD